MLFFIFGQVNEALNPAKNFSTYEFKDREVKLYYPKYDTVTGTSLGQYDTLTCITVRGIDEYFLVDGYSKKDSKILHSFHKKRMLSSFSGTFFKRQCIQYESRALDTDLSEIFYFLPSTMDRMEDINRNMGSVNFYSIDMPYYSSEVDENVWLDASKLDYENSDKTKMTEAVIKVL